MPEARVVVVGTTVDYISYVQEHWPGRCVFVTDPLERAKLAPVVPGPEDEIRCPLTPPETVINAIEEHRKNYEYKLDGIVAFDCETMELTARIADHFGLTYPSLETVRLCRDKFAMKAAWRRHGAVCPAAAVVMGEWDLLDWARRHPGPLVLKPMIGTGSELTFKCADGGEALATYRTMRAAESNPLRISSERTRPAGFVAEEYITGREYSCDFILEDDKVTLVRLAKKLPARDQSFGTTAAYLVPPRLPRDVTLSALRDNLKAAAKALGLTRAMAMADFIISRGRIVFIEMTPRPGGDCLPPLVRRSAGVDTLELALDFAQGRSWQIPAASKWEQLVGVRLFARESGRIVRIDRSLIEADPRVLECTIIRESGHRVVLPPLHYDSRILGYVIFRPTPDGPRLETQCAEITSRLIIETDTDHHQYARRSSATAVRNPEAANPAS